MKREVKFVLEADGELTLMNAYGDNIPSFAPQTIAAAAQGVTAQLTPNAYFPQKTIYSLVSGGKQTPFVVPRGELPIDFKKLTAYSSLNGYIVWNGDIKSYEFASSLIERIDAHIRDLKTLREYEGAFFEDFCRAEDGEFEREDLTALDHLLFFDLACGNSPDYPTGA